MKHDKTSSWPAFYLDSCWCCPLRVQVPGSPEVEERESGETPAVDTGAGLERGETTSRAFEKVRTVILRLTSLICYHLHFHTLIHIHGYKTKSLRIINFSNSLIDVFKNFTYLAK